MTNATNNLEFLAESNLPDNALSKQTTFIGMQSSSAASLLIDNLNSHQLPEAILIKEEDKRVIVLGQVDRSIYQDLINYEKEGCKIVRAKDLANALALCHKFGTKHFYLGFEEGRQKYDEAVNQLENMGSLPENLKVTVYAFQQPLERITSPNQDQIIILGELTPELAPHLKKYYEANYRLIEKNNVDEALQLCQDSQTKHLYLQLGRNFPVISTALKIRDLKKEGHIPDNLQVTIFGESDILQQEIGFLQPFKKRGILDYNS